MEVAEKREPVVLYQVPLLAELQVKSLIINSFPQLALSLQHIQLRKKEGKYQAFVMVPAGQVQNFCGQKDLTLGKEKVYPKKWNTEAQIFIGRLPDSLSVEDISAALQKQFGKIQHIFQGKPHQESKIKLRHCYIQFQKDEDAQKCIFSNKKIVVKDHELRPIRAYAWNESEETDKKVWMKVTSPIQDQAQLQSVLNQQFRKEGKLRERIRVDGNKAIIQYTSSEGAEQALQTFKNGKVGKYEVVVRPYANKDTHTVFVSGLKPTVTAAQLEAAFKHYQPLISCNVSTGKDPNIKSGTITFGSQQTFKKVFVEYKQDPNVRPLFVKQPYLTVHMSAKERNDYINFRKGKGEYAPVQKKPLVPNPIGFFPGYPQYPQYPQMPPQNMYAPGFGRQMGGFGYNNPSPFQ